MQQDQVFPLVLMIWLVPKKKAGIIEQAEEEVRKIQAQFASGLVTQGERYNKVVIFGRVPMI